VAVAGCGGSDVNAALKPPPGFSVYRGPHAELAYPATWRLQPPRPDSLGSGQVVEIDGITGVGARPPQVILGETAKYFGSFQDALQANELDSSLRLAQRTILARRPVTLPGGRDARITESQYLDPGKPGTGPPVAVHTFDLVALGPGHLAVNLFARVPANDPQLGQISTLMGSLRLR